MTLLSRLRTREDGAALVELALAAPVLAAIIMIASDVSLAFSRKLQLEQGAQRAVEKVMQTTQLANVQTNIAQEVALQADVDASQVSVTFPKFCDEEELPDLGRDADGFAIGECDPGESEAHYIQVVVWDDYDPIFSTLNLGTKQANGTYRVEARAGMRTR